MRVIQHWVLFNSFVIWTIEETKRKGPKPNICCQYLYHISSGVPFLEVMAEKQCVKHMGQLVWYTENLTWRGHVHGLLHIRFCVIFFSLMNSQAPDNFMSLL